MGRIVAGIVVYKPNLERLRECIDSLRTQVSDVVIYDNGGAASLSDLKNKSSMHFIGTGNNLGLSKGLNSIMQYVLENIADADWVLTMDQDSLTPVDMLKAFMCDQMDANVAIVCPQVVDKRRAYMIPDTNMEFSEVNKCITSASCTRIKAWQDVGGFDENLFIDLIDNDFCKRLIISGWIIKRANAVVLDQQFGDIERKAEWKVEFYMKIARLVRNKKLSTNIAKLTYKKNVSPLRVYHTNKNIIYLNKKLANYGGIGYESYQCNSYLGFMICFSLASLIRGKNKFEILRAIIKGRRDGKKMKAEEFVPSGIWAK